MRREREIEYPVGLSTHDAKPGQSTGAASDGRHLKTQETGSSGEDSRQQRAGVRPPR